MKLFLIFLGLLVTTPVLWLRGGLFQEPVTTALAAMRLEFHIDDWIELADGSEVILKTGNLKNFLQSIEVNDWRHVDTMGSGYVFLRGDKRAICTCRLYSARFSLCKLPESLRRNLKQTRLNSTQ